MVYTYIQLYTYISRAMTTHTPHLHQHTQGPRYSKIVRCYRIATLASANHLPADSSKKKKRKQEKRKTKNEKRKAKSGKAKKQKSKKAKSEKKHERPCGKGVPHMIRPSLIYETRQKKCRDLGFAAHPTDRHFVALSKHAVVRPRSFLIRQTCKKM